MTFNAEVTGYPEPTVQWTKTDVEITSDLPGFKVEQEGGVHRLIISQVRPAMAALYCATAKNDVGQISSRGRLKVKRKCEHIIICIFMCHKKNNLSNFKNRENVPRNITLFLQLQKSPRFFKSSRMQKPLSVVSLSSVQKLELSLQLKLFGS